MLHFLNNESKKQGQGLFYSSYLHKLHCPGGGCLGCSHGGGMEREVEGQNVVDLMEPYGQISNGIEFLNPPLDIVLDTSHVSAYVHC
ncbi:hypothetical protein CK203_027682 [Vitis vinifera]|uniref:Uncharacterized protein n=1 Tax=Vitis vinifera TaxID=29760 RepID=A0A438IH47_VITVI|nr:hypothetical protein CK203_027682 [Vitis vinifera]